ncbi:hypothetical protein [Mycobacterium sp. URHB0044]|uniref:hypothetical protein n=1 Tax=Mycobacterium sp. URHB0044 TaxID=1380386 RepID=UPI000A4BA935|nr:hypothetical protein [Mycobacterium sp. URHB0044]
MAAEPRNVESDAAPWADDRPVGTVRTAVVVVHGMGEQRPMDTLDGFVKTALHPLSDLFPPTDKKWEYYYSRPAEITGSYEARRYIARPLRTKSDVKQGQAEIYEYHWSYLMTGNRFADLGPTTLRLFLRRPSNVPDPLFGIWRVVWLALLAIPVAMAALLVGGHLLNKDVPWWILGAITSVVVLLFWLGVLRFLVRAVIKSVTASFVDVARYLDTAPHSYAARRAIRGGLVDLLHALHDEGRYSRVIVVAHSLGAYIAYDALTSFWAQVHQLHAPPPDDQTPLPIKLPHLAELQKAADELTVDATTEQIDDFQELQFALWQDLRAQGNPWRITDFISAGTPMALADILVTRPKLFSGLTKSDRTRRHDLFDGLVRRGALVKCPPRTETLPVEGNEQPKANYAYKGDGIRQVLGSQSPFAVTRWTNLWFPVNRGGLKGDWFGGPLRPLFGRGIRDIEVQGNQPERFKRGMAHTQYFAHPDKGGADDAAGHIRKAMALQTHEVLARLLTAPTPDPSTAERPVQRPA